MPRIGRTLAACALALVVLAGCSSSDGNKTASSTPTTKAAAGPTSTVRPVDTSFTGQNSAQFCVLAKTYNDKFANVGSASTPAQLKTLTQDGRTAINQAVTAAPAEIKPDVQVLSDAFSALYNELDRVNFDATKVQASAFSALQTPQFQASTVRFQAYLKNVCGVGG